jgi:hypothetical protein
MSRDPDGKLHCCEKCRYAGDLHYRKDLDEYWCDGCISDENEAAYERHQESLMGDGPETAREEQLRTWKEHQEAHKR